MEPATPPAPAAGVTATVDLSPVAASLGGAHLLPCGIRQNGGAPVSDYFKPRATGPFPPTQIPRFLFPAHLVEEWPPDRCGGGGGEGGRGLLPRKEAAGGYPNSPGWLPR